LGEEKENPGPILQEAGGKIVRMVKPTGMERTSYRTFPNGLFSYLVPITFHVERREILVGGLKDRKRTTESCAR